MPYRSVFAVLTQDSILVYDTVHAAPLAVMRGLHYANLTNATWSPDGHSLVVSSSDGYVTLVRFSSGELGEVYERPVVAPPVEAATETTTTPEPIVSVPRPPVVAPATVLPPVEQGTTIVLEGRPAKKVKRITPMCIKRKTEDMPSVQDLSLVEPKKKKRIQPVLMSTARN